MIAAVARNGVIGRDGRLPWRLPEDLQHFRRLTTGHCVIMGRRTWESLPHPLANRQNIVVTRQPTFAAAGAAVAHSLDDALAMVERDGPAFCIGGGELYRVALPHADIAYVTEIDCDVDGDATFPPLDPAQWRETAREPQPACAPDGFEYAFVTYERKMNNLR
jgi:dihydrofolate reductase